MNEERSDDRKLRGLVRDVLLTGVATVFMTEESLRNFVKDMKLPKDLASLFTDSVLKKKEDLYKLVAREFGHFLSKVDVASELSRFLTDHDVQFTVSFKKRKSHEKNH